MIDSVPPRDASATLRRRDAIGSAPCRRIALSAAIAVSAWSVSAFADETATDSLAGLPIRSVQILIRDVYDPLPPGRLRALYRLANQLHVCTLPVTVRAELLFRPGDRWNPSRARETERNLRALDFLVPERTLAVARGDSVDVVVATQDNWTTSPELQLESGGGQRFGSFSFTEKNLLGLGTTVSASYREDPLGIARFVQVGDQNVFGTHVRAAFTAGSGSVGSTHAATLESPFYAEETRRVGGVTWSRVLSEMSLSRGGDVLARFGLRREDAEVYGGLGGRSAGGVVRRLVASFYASDRRFQPSRLEPGAPDAFAGDFEESRQRRVGVEGRLWKPHYVTRRDIEAFDRVEDFDLGMSVALKFGWSPVALGASTGEGYARLRFAVGADAPNAGFGYVRGSVSSWFRREALETVGQLDGRWVKQPASRLTLVAAGWAAGAREAPRDWQLVLGGLNGLRAYPVNALTGTQAARFNTEARVRFASGLGRIVSLGGATFFDAARAWGPGSSDGPWHFDAGLGLRLALPRSALNKVARIDVAWPISPTRDGRREPVFSFGSSQAF